MMQNPSQSPVSASRALARFGAGLCLEKIPAPVRKHARLLLLDLLGAGLAGVDTSEVKAALDAVRQLEGGPGPAVVWGTGFRAGPGHAAFVNGVAAHARELDDFGGVDHSGAVVVPALLALCDGFGPISGDRFLTAMIYGYDVGRRVLDAAGGYRPHNHGDGFHSTGTCGSFAAAAGASLVLNLTEEQTVWAFGLAGSSACGTWAFIKDGAMSKRFHPGRAAEAGVFCAVLAKSGFTGPEFVFESDWGGFFTTLAKTAPRPRALLEEPGRESGVMRSGIKPYACCRDIHSTLDVVLDLKKKHHLTPDDIHEIRVGATKETLEMVGTCKRPKTRRQAQLSLAYGVGVALAAGRALLPEYEPPWLDSPEVGWIMDRVRIQIDPELKTDAEPKVEIATKDGRRLSGHVDFAKGAPQNPLEDAEVIEKFRTLARRCLAEDRVNALEKMVLAVEDLADMREVTRCLTIKK